MQILPPVITKRGVGRTGVAGKARAPRPRATNPMYLFSNYALLEGVFSSKSLVCKDFYKSNFKLCTEFIYFRTKIENFVRNYRISNWMVRK